MNKQKLEVLTPQNSQLIFIDHQPQMAFGVQSIDRQALKNNVVALAKSAKVFGIPTIITTVETDSFSGHTYPELLAVFPEAPLLERTSMNSWDDQKVRDALADERNELFYQMLTEVQQESAAEALEIAAALAHLLQGDEPLLLPEQTPQSKQHPAPDRPPVSAPQRGRGARASSQPLPLKGVVLLFYGLSVLAGAVGVLAAVSRKFAHKIPFVVIDQKEEEIEVLQRSEEKILYIQGVKDYVKVVTENGNFLTKLSVG